MPKSRTPLRVKKWICTGELSACKTEKEIIEQCGRLLDRNCSGEILGEVLFKATNGKYYVVTVEAVIEEANPEYVKDALANDD